jgi:hypothetical protein
MAGFCRTTVVDVCLTGDLSRDFTGDTFVFTVTFGLGFDVRFSSVAAAFLEASLAATHLSQLGSAHTLFFLVFVEAVLPEFCD